MLPHLHRLDYAGKGKMRALDRELTPFKGRLPDLHCQSSCSRDARRLLGRVLSLLSRHTKKAARQTSKLGAVCAPTAGWSDDFGGRTRFFRMCSGAGLGS